MDNRILCGNGLEIHHDLPVMLGLQVTEWMVVSTGISLPLPGPSVGGRPGKADSGTTNPLSVTCSLSAPGWWVVCKVRHFIPS